MNNGSARTILSLLKKDAIVAPPDFNRWKMPAVSIAMHLCIGSVYSWSIFNAPLTRFWADADSDLATSLRYQL